MMELSKMIDIMRLYAEYFEVETHILEECKKAQEANRQRVLNAVRDAGYRGNLEDLQKIYDVMWEAMHSDDALDAASFEEAVKKDITFFLGFSDVEGDEDLTDD